MAETREAVVINLPKDDTVNGYRTENPDYSDLSVVSIDHEFSLNNSCSMFDMAVGDRPDYLDDNIKY